MLSLCLSVSDKSIAWRTVYFQQRKESGKRKERNGFSEGLVPTQRTDNFRFKKLSDLSYTLIRNNLRIPQKVQLSKHRGLHHQYKKSKAIKAYRCEEAFAIVHVSALTSSCHAQNKDRCLEACKQ